MLWDVTQDTDGHWRQGLRLLLAGLRASSGTDEAPIVDTGSEVATHRLMHARKQGLGLEDAIEMVNWTVEQGLVESPQRAARATVAKQIRITCEPAKRIKRGVSTRRPPKVPAAEPAKVRRTPFTIENPCTMIHTQWWFKGYDKYKSKIDLCSWGGAYKSTRAYGTPSKGQTSGAPTSATISPTVPSREDAPATPTQLVERRREPSKGPTR